MSRLTIQLIILTTLVVGWTIFMFYQQSRHEKRMKELGEWWKKMVRAEEMLKPTDKLSPQKKMGKHMMR